MCSSPGYRTANPSVAHQHSASQRADHQRCRHEREDFRTDRLYPCGVTIFPNAGNGAFTAAPTQMAGATAFVQQPQQQPMTRQVQLPRQCDFALGQVGYFQNLGAAASVQAGQFVAAPLITGTDTDGNFETFEPTYRSSPRRTSMAMESRT